MPGVRVSFAARAGSGALSGASRSSNVPHVEGLAGRKRGTAPARAQGGGVAAGGLLGQQQPHHLGGVPALGLSGGDHLVATLCPSVNPIRHSAGNQPGCTPRPAGQQHSATGPAPGPPPAPPGSCHATPPPACARRSATRGQPAGIDPHHGQCPAHRRRTWCRVRCGVADDQGADQTVRMVGRDGMGADYADGPSGRGSASLAVSYFARSLSCESSQDTPVGASWSGGWLAICW